MSTREPHLASIWLAAEYVHNHLDQYLGAGDATILVIHIAEFISNPESRKHWMRSLSKALEGNLDIRHPDGMPWFSARAHAVAQDALKQWEADHSGQVEEQKTK